MKKKTKVTRRRPLAPGPSAEDVYSLEAVVQITEIPRTQIAVYCRHGLIAPLAGSESDDWRFDATAIHALRRLAGLRSEFGFNLAGARTFCELLAQIEKLQAEVRFLRGR